MGTDQGRMSMEEVAVRRFRQMAGLFGLVFGIVGLSFWFLPDYILNQINHLGGLFNLPEPQLGQEHFWGAMTVSMMATITVLSWMIYQDPLENKNMIVPLITAKVTSSVTGLYYFIFYAPYFCHVVIALSDMPIAIVLYLMYRQAFGGAALSRPKGDTL